MESPNPFSREVFLAPTSSPKPSKTPRPPRSKRRIVGVIGAVVLCGVASFLVPYFIREHRRNPYATMQNGLILRAIHASDYQPFVQTSQNTYQRNYPTIEVELAHGSSFFRAEGRASTGDTVLLNRGDSRELPTNPLDLLLGDRQSVVINLPQFGVPSTFKWVDVTVEDTKKHKATWRVYGLPALKHTIPATIPLQEQQKARGIAAVARAWQAHDASQPYSPYLISVEVRTVVPPSVLTHPSEVWNVQIQSVDLEWEPSFVYPRFPVDERMEMPRFLGRKHGPPRGSGVFYADASVQNVSFSPAAQHIARIHALLVRSDVAVETVTFRNLPLLPFGKGRRVDFASPPFLVTPSGVRVELHSPGSSVPSKKSHARNDVALSYQVSVKPTPKTSTQSSQFVSAVCADADAFRTVENNYSFYFSISDPNKRILGYNFAYLVDAKNAAQSTLPALTINVARQTERESIPITFVVPIKAAPPKDVWRVQ